MTFIKEAMELDSEQEKEFYNANMFWVQTHLRYVLDHLDDGTFWTYKVSFYNYYRHKKAKLYKP